MLLSSPACLGSEAAVTITPELSRADRLTGPPSPCPGRESYPSGPAAHCRRYREKVHTICNVCTKILGAAPGTAAKRHPRRPRNPFIHRSRRRVGRAPPFRAQPTSPRSAFRQVHRQAAEARLLVLDAHLF